MSDTQLPGMPPQIPAPLPPPTVWQITVFIESMSDDPFVWHNAPQQALIDQSGKWVVIVTQDGAVHFIDGEEVIAVESLPVRGDS